MKLTLEPHNDSELVRNTTPYSTISVSVPADDLTLTEFFEELIIPALLAFGFAQSAIDEWLDKPACDPEMLDELDSLRRWKDEAKKCLPDYQKLGSLLGMPIGVSVHDKLYDAVELLFDMTCQHWCGCLHPACNRCGDDKFNAALLKKLGKPNGPWNSFGVPERDAETN